MDLKKEIIVLGGPYQKKIIEEAFVPLALPRIVSNSKCEFTYRGDLDDADLRRLGDIGKNICEERRFEVRTDAPEDIFSTFRLLLVERARCQGVDIEPSQIGVLRTGKF